MATGWKVIGQSPNTSPVSPGSEDQENRRDIFNPPDTICIFGIGGLFLHPSDSARGAAWIGT
jgi:hypothetical protein